MAAFLFYTVKNTLMTAIRSLNSFLQRFIFASLFHCG
jgi:hypothetical protein